MRVPLGRSRRRGGGPDRTHARQRVPRPFIGRRVPSGRGATEQPNAVGDGPAPLTPLFWVLLVGTGVASGLFGALTMLVLHTAQHLAYNYRHGEFQAAVERSSWLRRLVVLALAGGFAGVAWFWLRRWTPGQQSDVHGTLWDGGSVLPWRRSLPSAVFSEIVVGMGASLGREQAPQLMGAVSGSLLGRWGKLPSEQRRLLLACGSGAGLGAVYNVPVGGALITAELLYGQITLPVVVPALVASVTATVVSWVYLPDQATYTSLPTFHLSTPEVVWALLMGPVIGVVAVAWTRLIGWVSAYTASGRRLLVAPLAAFVVLAVTGFAYPQLFGNGQDIAQTVFLGHGTLLLLLALFALKPLVTLLCLGSGASGGLLTPTFSTGAVVGGLTGGAWSLLWPGAPLGAYALIGAGAMLAAALQAPLAGIVLTLELTQTTFGLAVPIVIAAGLATVVARYLDGYSIYTSRLPPK